MVKFLIQYSTTCHINWPQKNWETNNMAFKIKWKQISIQFRKHHDSTFSGRFATEITAAITGFGIMVPPSPDRPDAQVRSKPPVPIPPGTHGRNRTLKKKKSKNKEAGTYLYTYVYLPTKYSGEAGPIAGISYRKVRNFSPPPLKKNWSFRILSSVSRCTKIFINYFIMKTTSTYLYWYLGK